MLGWICVNFLKKLSFKSSSLSINFEEKKNLIIFAF